MLIFRIWSIQMITEETKQKINELCNTAFVRALLTKPESLRDTTFVDVTLDISNKTESEIAEMEAYLLEEYPSLQKKGDKPGHFTMARNDGKFEVLERTFYDMKNRFKRGVKLEEATKVSESNGQYFPCISKNCQNIFRKSIEIFDKELSKATEAYNVIIKEDLGKLPLDETQQKVIKIHNDIPFNTVQSAFKSDSWDKHVKGRFLLDGIGPPSDHSHLWWIKEHGDIYGAAKYTPSTSTSAPVIQSGSTASSSSSSSSTKKTFKDYLTDLLSYVKSRNLEQIKSTVDIIIQSEFPVNKEQSKVLHNLYQSVSNAKTAADNQPNVTTIERLIKDLGTQLKNK